MKTLCWLTAMLMMPSFAFALDIDLKGTKLGMTKAALIAMHPNLECWTSGCSYEKRNLLTTRPMAFSLMTFAGVEAIEWRFQFDKTDALYRVEITLPTSAVAPILTGLNNKYGKPKNEEETQLQTLGGAKTTRSTTIWEMGDSRLLVASPSEKITEMSVQLTSIAKDAADAEKAKARAKTDL